MWFFTALLACSAPVEPPPTAYERIAADCVLEAPDGGPPVAGAGVLHPVTETCATTVGDAISLDWDSFGEEPRAFTHAQTPAEIVIGGYLLAVATQGSTIAQALNDPAPVELAAHLTRVKGLNDLSDGDDAGELWAAFLAGTISGFTYTGSTAYAMGFHEGEVSVGDIADQAEDPDGMPTLADPTDVPAAAAVIVHEAGHDIYRSHVDCGELYESADIGCDETPEGAYGVGTWWLWNWLSANAGRLERATCWEVEDRLLLECSLILDSTGFTPCDSTVDPCWAG